jgi:hypothetical protein
MISISVLGIFERTALGLTFVAYKQKLGIDHAFYDAAWRCLI